MNIVLLEPEIPENTGNIGRTCVITGATLHLIYPLGFILSEKNIKSAGLDYWERLKVIKHDSYDDFLNYVSMNKGVIWFATTKGHQKYTDVKYNDNDYIVFGKESKGIPEDILSKDEKHCVRIPMIKNERSLNLANSVAIILYEALRQNDFKGLTDKGELHNLKYESNR